MPRTAWRMRASFSIAQSAHGRRHGRQSRCRVRHRLWPSQADAWRTRPSPCGPIAVWNLGPDVHRGPGQSTIQPASRRPLTSTSGAFGRWRQCRARPGRPPARRWRPPASRREGAVVVIALMRARAATSSAVADHEADAPAGHVVALLSVKNSDRHVLAPEHLHDGQRLPAVEHDVGIGQVVHHRCRASWPRRSRARRSPVPRTARSGCWEPSTIILAWGSCRGWSFELGKEVHAVDAAPSGCPRPRSRHHRCGWGSSGRHQHGVAAVQRGQHQMRGPFRADGDDGLVVGSKSTSHSGRGTSERSRGAGAGCPCWPSSRGCRPLRGFGELGDDVRRRGPIGVAHAHVDDVFAASAGGQLQLGRDVEDVGGRRSMRAKAALVLEGTWWLTFT